MCVYESESQSYPTLCHPMDYIVDGILQARILEWVAFPFCRGSARPRNRTGVSALQADFLPTELCFKSLCISGKNSTFEKKIRNCILAVTAAAAKSLQSCPTLCHPIDGSPPGLPRPWDSSGKNTGVGCHFLLQCMKVTSESEVAQSCLTLRDPMDCSLLGSSVHGISQARVLEWGAIAFSRAVTSQS